MMCPHGGTVQAIDEQHARAGRRRVRCCARPTRSLIAGCPFVLGVVPHPCVQVQWVQPAARSKATGDFTLTEASVGLCVAADQAVQGTVLIVMAQPQVAGL